MQVDVSFSFAKVYNVEKIDVTRGQEFTLYTDATEPIQWFSDNDPALSIDASGAYAGVTAERVGTAKILLMDSAFGILKTISINVVDAIIEPAKTLGLQAGEPEPK